MTKKQLHIIIISIILAALLAASIAVPILVLNNISKVPAPSFTEFDQLSDMTIKVQWKKVSKANSYDIEYCYGNPQDENNVKTSGVTESTFFSIERKKGVLNVRVRASFAKEKGKYSQWVLYNINPIKLAAPTIEISDTLLVRWTEVKYKYYNVKKVVPSYVYEINLKSVEKEITIESIDIELNSINIVDYIMSYVLRTYGNVTITQEAWDDITITISVKAVNYTTIGSDKIALGDNKFVYSVYEESEYASSSYTLTLQDYQRIKNIQG